MSLSHLLEYRLKFWLFTSVYLMTAEYLQILSADTIENMKDCVNTCCQPFDTKPPKLQITPSL